MSGSAFLDTNLLVYLAMANSDRAGRVEALLVPGAVVSVQVLNETANVLRRKGSLSWAETRDFLSAVRSLVRVEPLTSKRIMQGCGSANAIL